MTDEREDQERAPSEPAQDPKVEPRPPSNPDVDHDDVERGVEQIEKVVGN